MKNKLLYLSPDASVEVAEVKDRILDASGQFGINDINLDDSNSTNFFN